MLPIVALLALAGGFWAYNTLPFIAEDCYFYAIIARNLALRGVQSYWGTELTNGVHPLWALTLAATAGSSRSSRPTRCTRAPSASRWFSRCSALAP